MVKSIPFLALLMLILPFAACGEPQQSNLGAGAGATQESIKQEMLATRQAKVNTASDVTATQAGSAETPEPSATVTALPSPTPVELSGEPTATASVPDVLSEEPAGYLLSRLPPLVAFPEGFAITREGRSNAESLSQIFLDPQFRLEYQQYLERLGLQRAAMRFYDLLGATYEDARTRMVHMRTNVLEFDSWGNASEWMNYELDRWLRCECEMDMAHVEPIGDEVLVVHGINSGTDTGLPALAVIWVRQGATVWELEAESLEHDPLPDAVEIMKATIAQPDDRMEVTLPWTLNLPEGSAVTREQSQSADDVAQAYEPDVSRYLDHQLHWGFVQAHMRAYTFPEAQASQMDSLFAQVVEFGSPDQATSALTYAYDFALAKDGYADAQVEPIGDHTRVVTGTQVADDGTVKDVAVVWLRISNRVYTYSGTTSAYLPLPVVYRIADESLARTGH